MIALFARLKNLIVLATAAAMAACAPEPPKCGAPETKGLALQILVQSLAGSFPLDAEELKSILTLELATPTKAYDKSIRQHTCNAALTAYGKQLMSVGYTSQVSDEDQHIVQLKEIAGADVQRMMINLTVLSLARSDSPAHAKPDTSSTARSGPAEKTLAPVSDVAPSVAPPAPEQPMPTTAKEGPSFSCAGPLTVIEHAICITPVLARLDAAMAGNVRASLDARMDEESKKEMTAKQRAFLAERNRCQDASCIESAYRQRVDEVCTERTEVVPVCVTSAAIN